MNPAQTYFLTLLFSRCQNYLNSLAVLFASFIRFLLETKLRTYLISHFFGNILTEMRRNSLKTQRLRTF